MATTTTNLGLIKPAGTDKIRISQINSNMDTIDAKIGPVGSTSLQAQINSLDSNKVNKTDVIAVAQGGTGSTSSAAARTALAVPGLSTTNEFTGTNFFYNPTYPSIGFRVERNGVSVGSMLVYGNTNQLVLRERHVNSPDYYEGYALPVPDSNRTSSGSYNILTSKNPVTIAQGGTGATGSTTIAITPSSGYTLQRNYSRRWGKIVCLNCSFTIPTISTAGWVTVATYTNGLSGIDTYFRVPLAVGTSCPIVDARVTDSTIMAFFDTNASNKNMQINVSYIGG